MTLKPHVVGIESFQLAGQMDVSCGREDDGSSLANSSVAQSLCFGQPYHQGRDAGAVEASLVEIYVTLDPVYCFFDRFKSKGVASAASLIG